jgi:hypothetical protein
LPRGRKFAGDEAVWRLSDNYMPPTLRSLSPFIFLFHVVGTRHEAETTTIMDPRFEAFTNSIAGSSAPSLLDPDGRVMSPNNPFRRKPVPNSHAIDSPRISTGTLPQPSPGWSATNAIPLQPQTASYARPFSPLAPINELPASHARYAPAPSNYTPTPQMPYAAPNPQYHPQQSHYILSAAQQQERPASSFMPTPRTPYAVPAPHFPMQ